ncbi:MAG: TSUP family transporter [Bacteroidales bacterium]
MKEIALLLLGVSAGAFSGLIGIGGGIIMVPALVFFFGFSQHAAQGTTLAVLLPPVSLLACYVYYKSGNLDIWVATIIAVGFFIGSLFGSKLAVVISPTLLSKIFAVILIAVGIKMLIK